MSDIHELDVDGSRFGSLLSQLPQGDPVKAEWLEDDLVPYTPYDRWRDRVAWWRAEFLRRIAPRV